MKTYKNLIEIALSDEIMDEALNDASLRKRNRPEVAKVIANREFVKEKIRQKFLYGDPVPFTHRAYHINDGFKLKKRKVIQPNFTINKPEQWIQHIVVKTLIPIFMHGMYEFSCGSVPERGIHYGKKYLEKFIKKNPKKIKYVLKLDIFHFYESVNLDLLKKRFEKIIKDKYMLKMIYFIIDSNVGIFEDGERIQSGLPIGFYTSQWFANYFLQPFDHYVKEELKASFYMRYMDDIVIFGSNKKELKKIFLLIEKYLSSLDLKVKENWQIFRFDYIDKNGKRLGRPVDFMGFKFYRDKTTIRKTIFLRACRVARRLKKKAKISWFDACRILSYIGWFRKTDSYCAYKKHIESNVNITACKKLISKHAKMQNKENKK